MYENKTADNIRDEQLGEMRADIDKREGSIAYDLVAANATAAEVNFIELDTVLALGFAPTSGGYFLELRAVERGITRKEAVAASGSVTFTGANDLLVPAGARLVTADVEPVYFTTTADGIIVAGIATVTAEAETAGAIGNVLAGKITALAEGEDLADVLTVTNPADFSGGVDIEDDESLLARLLDDVRTPATSGNPADYRKWSVSIAGIGAAKVYPIWGGGGTVKVVLLGDDGRTPPAGKVTEVETYIESVRPVGPVVTVVGATEIAIDIGATLTLDTDVVLATVTAAFEETLAEYLQSIAFTDEPVRYSRIAALILATEGVLDYASLTLEGGTANVSIADASIPVKGVVTFV